jgi:hypothetical protein
MQTRAGSVQVSCAISLRNRYIISGHESEKLTHSKGFHEATEIRQSSGFRRGYIELFARAHSQTSHIEIKQCTIRSKGAHSDQCAIFDLKRGILPFGASLVCEEHVSATIFHPLPPTTPMRWRGAPQCLPSKQNYRPTRSTYYN